MTGSPLSGRSPARGAARSDPIRTVMGSDPRGVLGPGFRGCHGSTDPEKSPYRPSSRADSAASGPGIPPPPSKPLRIACTSFAGSQGSEPRTRSRSCSTRRRWRQLSPRQAQTDTSGHGKPLSRVDKSREGLLDEGSALRIKEDRPQGGGEAETSRRRQARARVRGLPAHQAIEAPPAQVGDHRKGARRAVRPATDGCAGGADRGA